MNKLLYSIALLGLLTPSNCFVFNGTDLLSSSETTLEALAKEYPEISPNPEDLHNLLIQVLVGLPEKVFFTVFNLFCSIYLAADAINPLITPNASALSLRLHSSACNESSFSLDHGEELLSSPDFFITKKVVIFSPGWGVSSEIDFVLDMANAYLCRGDYNFMVLNNSDAIDTLYTWSSYNTDAIGALLAKTIEKLVERVPLENIHVIGHSLGAQIAGATGRYFKEYTGLNIPRVTGLDPAYQCFNEGETLPNIQRGDGDFVDIIHTNPGGFGQPISSGDADFYPGGLLPIKPGCENDTITCSHVRSVLYYTESVYPGNEDNFLGVECTSLIKVKDGICSGPGYPMGYATPSGLIGNYFLEVNADPPYGKNNGGRPAVPSQCEYTCEKK